MIIFTSISPRALDRQQKAIASWHELEFRVVSINSRDEVGSLGSQYPDVEFRVAERDASTITDRPLIFINELLGHAARSKADVCGIINADIEIVPDRRLIDTLHSETRDSLLYASRVDVTDSSESAGPTLGEPYVWGYDAFFFHPSVFGAIPPSSFCLGAPWWDYWLPVAAVKRGVDIKYLLSDAFLHQKHATNYDENLWNKLGIAFADLFDRRIAAELRSQLRRESEQINRGLTDLSAKAVSFLDKNSKHIPFIVAEERRSITVDWHNALGRFEAVGKDAFVECAILHGLHGQAEFPGIAEIRRGFALLHAPDRKDKALGMLLRGRIDLAGFLLENTDRVPIDVLSGSITHRDMYQFMQLSFLPHSEKDEYVRSQLIGRTSGWHPERPDAAALLLAAMLYLGPHKFPVCHAVERMPGWLGDSYVAYMNCQRLFFDEQGESEDYIHFLTDWTNYLLTGVKRGGDVADWKRAASSLLADSTYVAEGLVTNNVKDLFQARGLLLEGCLKIDGRTLDYEFGRRDGGNKKVRLGVLGVSLTGNVETYLSLPIYQNLDRSRFEVFLIAISAGQDQTTRYCSSFADHVVFLGSGDLQAQVDAVRALDLDVLWIGTNVSYFGGRAAELACHRLARIQLAGCCSPVTTGFRNVDMFVSGTRTEPDAGADSQYVEKLVRIDGVSECYALDAVAQSARKARFDRQQLGIGTDDIVLASGTSYSSLGPELLSAWIDILKSIPLAKLLLYPFCGRQATTAPVTITNLHIRDTLKRHGLGPDRAIVINHSLGAAEIRTLLRLADLYLDSFPSSDGATTVHPLLVGLPTLTLEGEAQRSRRASGMLRELRIDELVASDTKAYVRLAVALARDQRLRASYSRRITEGMSRRPEFLDPVGYAGKIENLIRALSS